MVPEPWLVRYSAGSVRRCYKHPNSRESSAQWRFYAAHCRVWATLENACDPLSAVVPSQRRSTVPFPVVTGDLGPTSDRLPVNLSCRVSFSLQSIFKICKFSGLTSDFFLNMKKKKKLLLINFGFSFQFFSLNCSLIQSRLIYHNISRKYSLTPTEPTTYSCFLRHYVMIN